MSLTYSGILLIRLTTVESKETQYINWMIDNGAYDVIHNAQARFTQICLHQCTCLIMSFVQYMALHNWQLNSCLQKKVHIYHLLLPFQPYNKILHLWNMVYFRKLLAIIYMHTPVVYHLLYSMLELIGYDNLATVLYKGTQLVRNQYCPARSIMPPRRTASYITVYYPAHSII